MSAVTKLPSGWRWAQLRELGPLTDGDWILATDYADAGVRLLQLADIGAGELLDRSRRFINAERAQELGCTLLRPGDILISRMPDPIGRACLFPGLGYPCITAVDVSIWRPDEARTDRRYLTCALNSPDWLASVLPRASGATRPRISRANLESLSIPLPPLPEQRRISALLQEQLAKAERARAAADAQLEAAKALPEAYRRQVFQGEEARGWPRRALGEACRITAGQVDPTHGDFASMLHVSAEDIESGMGRLAELHTAAEDGMTSPKYLFEPGDVLYSKLRPYLRKAVLADFQGVCSADMYPVSCNPSMLDARYLVWVLLSEEFTRYADAESRRARMPKLNREQLLSWQAPVPPIGVQKQVAARLHEQIAGAVQLQEAAQLQAQYIAGFPAALLRRAFRGEL